jgi:hypothetical protein
VGAILSHPSRTHPPLAPLPPFKSWVTICRNFYVPDRKKLSHIPYFGDRELEDGTALVHNA